MTKLLNLIKSKSGNYLDILALSQFEKNLFGVSNCNILQDNPLDISDNSQLASMAGPKTQILQSNFGKID